MGAETPLGGPDRTADLLAIVAVLRALLDRRVLPGREGVPLGRAPAARDHDDGRPNWTGARLAWWRSSGGEVIKRPSPRNVLKDTYDHSCY